MAIICLIIMLISFLVGKDNRSLDDASAILMSKMMSSPEAVEVFNLDGGVFV